MSDNPNNTGEGVSSEAVVSRIRAKRDELQRILDDSLKRTVRWPILAGFMIFFGCFGCLMGSPPGLGKYELHEALIGAAIGVFVGFFGYFIVRAGARANVRAEIKKQDQLLGGAGLDKLQETLEEDFFTKLVKINFRYIDQYYLQTQSQANKSFTLCATVAVIGLMILTAGIVLMFVGKTTPAYVTASAGVIGEFIASVFFYLYNRTVLKMGHYHHKLVITQNVSIALKIAEGLPDADRIAVQKDLVARLTEDVNRLLTESNDKQS